MPCTTFLAQSPNFSLSYLPKMDRHCPDSQTSLCTTQCAPKKWQCSVSKSTIQNITEECCGGCGATYCFVNERQDAGRPKLTNIRTDSIRKLVFAQKHMRDEMKNLDAPCRGLGGVFGSDTNLAATQFQAGQFGCSLQVHEDESFDNEKERGSPNQFACLSGFSNIEQSPRIHSRGRIDR